MEKRKILCHVKTFPSNQFRVKFFGKKKGDLTEFLRQNHGGSKVPQFPYCVEHSLEKLEIHCHASFFPSNQFRVKFFSENVTFTEFLRQNGGSKIP